MLLSLQLLLLLLLVRSSEYTVDQISDSIRTTESYFNDLIGHASLLWFAFCTVVAVAVLVWPSWFVAVVDLAVIVLHVAVMDLFWGRHRLWPSLLWPSWFVAVMDLAVIVFHVAVMVCGRYSRSPVGLCIQLYLAHVARKKKLKQTNASAHLIQYTG